MNFSIDKQSDSLFRGSHACFVFVLSPFEQKFESLEVNTDHMHCEKDYFSFGSGE